MRASSESTSASISWARSRSASSDSRVTRRASSSRTRSGGEVAVAAVEQVEVLDLRLEPVADRDLALELLQHHRGAPHVLLAQAQDVAVDVVADVEHLLALDAGELLERDDVAGLVDLVARKELGRASRR